ncbi:MAG: efflux RND transporter periplasmic adaptor subunit [Bacteroidota bacterium]|nr:efflux RND transporter periplasmic adaptor subunit [Bacteroidota bacterium]
MKKRTLIISAILMASIGMMAWTLISNKKELNSKKEEKTVESKIAVTVATAQNQELTNGLDLTGKTEAEQDVLVAAESAGRIVQMNCKLGDNVQKGMVLAKIDDTYKKLAYENALVNYNKQKEDNDRYAILRKGDAVSDTQLRDAKVEFQKAAIQLKQAKKELDDTRIIAPFSGTITTKQVEVGSYVNVGSSIAGIANVAQLKVTLSVSESNAYLLHKGQVVGINSDIYPQMKFKGIITGISPQGSTSHTYPVEIRITNNNKNPLKAGTYVNVHVDMSKSVQALTIPRDAIISSIKEPSVYVITGDKVHLVRINTGRESNSSLEVLSGLHEGDKVVTNGQINLTEGARVSVIQSKL